MLAYPLVAVAPGYFSPFFAKTCRTYVMGLEGGLSNIRIFQHAFCVTPIFAN